MFLRPRFTTFVASVLLAANAVAQDEAAADAGAAPAEQAAQPEGSGAFASDNDMLVGDHLKLKVNVDGFERLNDKESKFCAPQGTKLKVTRQSDTNVYVRFKFVPQSDKASEKKGFTSTGEAPTKKAIEDCGTQLVNDYTQYTIETATLNDYAYRRTGVMFGALVVPFKFYLGSESRLSPAPTIAPYLGFRAVAPFNLTFTPLISTGLGLIPVTDPDTGETSTKAALSAAVGVLLTHSKNENFNAGFLLGKDFLSRTDRGNDKAVGDLWFSIYAGYAL